MLNTLIKGCPTIILRPIKKLYGSIPNEYKLGKCFFDTYYFLEQTREWTKARREDFQFTELQKLLQHAYQNVPYYRRVFDERNLSPKSIQDFSDLSLLPYLTREIIQDNIDDLVAINFKSNLMQYKITGGTTGIPMGFYDQRKYSESREWAFVTSLWDTIGYDIHRANRSVILRGVIPMKGHYEYKGLNLVLSSHHLQEDKMLDYIQRIIKFQPDYIQAYPSSIGILANFIIKNKIEINLKNLKAVICTSEVMHDLLREKIKEAFHTRVYSFYGHTERSCLAGECDKHPGYHLISEYGYTELINSAGKWAVNENELGEIVCTGFNNYVMPFIRYKTGDIGINTASDCSCGRSVKLLKDIQGRIQDFFINNEGDPAVFTGSDETLWPIKDKIIAYQFVQDQPGKVRLDIEQSESLCRHDLQMVEEEFTKMFPAIEADIRIISHIERTKSGKFRYLVQNIPTKKDLFT